MVNFIQKRSRCPKLPQFQFVLVYITEAHASDTWPMKWSVEWPRPTSLEQRIKYANTCAADLGLFPSFAGVVVDAMDDSFNEQFKCWPTTYFVIGENAELMYVGQPEDDATGDQGTEMYACYDVRDLLAFLRKWK